MANRRTVTAPPGGQGIAFTRELEGPASRVFAAHTQIETLARWTGPRGSTMEVRAFDARTGGLWSYVIRGSDGVGWAFFGSFHEVSAPHRLVQTFEFEGDPGHPTFETLTFTDLPGGRCRVDGLSLFGTVAERDAMLGGMDGGMDENYDRLDELLAAESGEPSAEEHGEPVEPSAAEPDGPSAAEPDGPSAAEPSAERARTTEG